MSKVSENGHAAEIFRTEPNLSGDKPNPHGTAGLRLERDGETYVAWLAKSGQSGDDISPSQVEIVTPMLEMLAAGGVKQVGAKLRDGSYFTVTRR